MANRTHEDILRQGKKAWRDWRRERKRTPDLRGAKLEGLNLDSVDLSGADLRQASFLGSSLHRTKFQGADLSGCLARFVRMSDARFNDATLAGADLRAASLRRADLTGADLSRTNLRFASLVGARVEGASFRKAEIYGLSAWNLNGDPGDQRELILRENNDPDTVTTTIDGLNTAQYLFLLRENANIAEVINTASARTVLLLGRFSPTHKKILDGLKAHLLERNFVPVLFDFGKPDGRDLTETVASLAHMACFVIPDLTGAKSVPQELSVIVPFLPSVPVVPILLLTSVLALVALASACAPNHYPEIIDLTVTLEPPAQGFQMATQPNIVPAGEEVNLCSVVKLESVCATQVFSPEQHVSPNRSDSGPIEKGEKQ